MKSTHRRALWLAWPLLVWLLAACAPARPPLLQLQESYNRQAAEDIYTVGYRNISEKYIEAMPVAQLALEGLRGLGSIDPSLTVERSADHVVLSHNSNLVARYLAPGDGDVRAWAQLTTNITTAGRRSSQSLRDAKPEKVYEAIFDGIISSLDPFSRYAGAAEAERNRANRDGFGGIGIRFTVRNGQVPITMVMPGSPAAKVGLKVDDRITHVGTIPVGNLKSYEIVAQFRGPVGSHVAVTVDRGEPARTLRFDVERDHIVPATVTERYQDGIIHFTISGFNSATASSLQAKLEASLAQHGGAVKGMVLDMRGNPGGLLKQSISVADLFVTQGDIVNTRGRHPDSHQHYEASGEDIAHGLPIVVLVDGKSASAAEIVAAALQDRRRAVVMGTTSFGKGTVQTVIRLPNDGEITLTWSRLIAPSGYVLHGLGVFPAICTSGTSGAGAGLLAKRLAERGKTVAIMESWRKAGLKEVERRRTLRAACPAERRREPLDIEVARRLLADSALYLRALDVSAATATAQY